LLFEPGAAGMVSISEEDLVGCCMILVDKGEGSRVVVSGNEL
jgi:hypothetical protein